MHLNAGQWGSVLALLMMGIPAVVFGLRRGGLIFFRLAVGLFGAGFIAISVDVVTSMSTVRYFEVVWFATFLVVHFAIR